MMSLLELFAMKLPPDTSQNLSLLLWHGLQTPIRSSVPNTKTSIRDMAPKFIFEFYAFTNFNAVGLNFATSG